MTNPIQAHIERVIALLEDPARWTQGEFARDAFGQGVMPTDVAAVCWCQLGAMRLTRQVSDKIDFIQKLLHASAESMEYITSVELNDNSDHATVMEMLYIAREHAEGAGV